MINKILLLFAITLALGSCMRINQESGKIAPTKVGAIDVEEYIYNHETPRFGEIFAETYLSDDNEMDYHVDPGNSGDVFLEEAGITSSVETIITIEASEFEKVVEFFEKYFFYFPNFRQDGVVGEFVVYYAFYRNEEEYLRPNTFGRGSERGSHHITRDSDGRLTIQPHGHDGWPGFVVDNTIDDYYQIQVTVHAGNFVALESDVGVLSQVPEVQADGFRLFMIGGRERVDIQYHERSTSELWQWLMDAENAGQLFISNPEPKVWPIPVREITNNMWSKWGIQAFVYGGDVTLIGGPGTLTEIPEFHEDTFYFPLATDADLMFEDGTSFASFEYEMQYIMHHELPNSRLWQLLSQNH